MIDEVTRAFSAAVEALTEALLSDRIDAASWFEAMWTTIDDHQRAAALAGRAAGVPSGNVFQRIVSTVRAAITRLFNLLRPVQTPIDEIVQSERAYLYRFAQQILNGELTPDQIRARAQMYANHAQQSYWSGATVEAAANGYSLERRTLGQSEHCEDCVILAGRGWQPLGTLPPPGQDSVCGSNCQCTMEYR